MHFSTSIFLDCVFPVCILKAWLLCNLHLVFAWCFLGTFNLHFSLCSLKQKITWTINCILKLAFSKSRKYLCRILSLAQLPVHTPTDSPSDVLSFKSKLCGHKFWNWANRKVSIFCFVTIFHHLRNEAATEIIVYVLYSFTSFIAIEFPRERR